MKKIILTLVLALTLGTTACADNQVFEKTMQFEGVTLVENKVEKSKFGITEVFLKEYNKKERKRYSVETLTKRQALKVYNYIWDTNKLDEIKDKEIAQSIFDWIFNNGNSAVIDVQRTVNNKLKKHGYTKRISEDYKIGPETIKYINVISRIDKHNFKEKLRKNRLNKYKNFRHWNQFGKGWKRRINSF